jgi:hypothetical protein
LTARREYRRYVGRGDAWLLPVDESSCEVVWNGDEESELRSFVVPRGDAWLVFERQAGLTGVPVGRVAPHRDRP